MVTPSAIAVIPARGGSKRIPRKNIIDFRGRPMIAWTIEAALRSQRFSRVMISTDDAEIAAVAERYGASVPFLRERYADDVTPVSLATVEALRQARSKLGEEYKTVVQLMANCPLRTEHDICAALDHFSERGAEAQISCFKFGWMNPWWAAKLDANGRPEALFPEAYRSGSQNLPELYCPSGAIWIADVSHLERHETFHSPAKIFWPMSWQSAMDIDDHEDFRMAEVLAEARDREDRRC